MEPWGKRDGADGCSERHSHGHLVGYSTGHSDKRYDKWKVVCSIGYRPIRVRCPKIKIGSGRRKGRAEAFLGSGSEGDDVLQYDFSQLQHNNTV